MAQALPGSLQTYARSGAYMALLRDQFRHIHRFLRDRLRDIPRDKRAQYMVILDIDETCICNIGMAYHEGVCMKGRAIPGALELFLFLVAEGVSVVFVTARGHLASHQTGQQLHALGFRGYVSVILHNRGTGTSPGDFKRRVRRHLASRWTILACIGDQVLDMDSDCQHGFLLFNPFYAV